MGIVINGVHPNEWKTSKKGHWNEKAHRAKK